MRGARFWQAAVRHVPHEGVLERPLPFTGDGRRLRRLHNRDGRVLEPRADLAVEAGEIATAAVQTASRPPRRAWQPASPRRKTIEAGADERRSSSAGRVSRSTVAPSSPSRPSSSRIRTISSRKRGSLRVIEDPVRPGGRRRLAEQFRRAAARALAVVERRELEDSPARPWGRDHGVCLRELGAGSREQEDRPLRFLQGTLAARAASARPSGDLEDEDQWRSAAAVEEAAEAPVQLDSRDRFDRVRAARRCGRADQGARGLSRSSAAVCASVVSRRSKSSPSLTETASGSSLRAIPAASLTIPTIGQYVMPSPYARQRPAGPRVGLDPPCQLGEQRPSRFRERDQRRNAGSRSCTTSSRAPQLGQLRPAADQGTAIDGRSGDLLRPHG